jgi:hypothetical protein
VPTSDLNMSGPLSSVYATDEDVYVEAGADFAVLVPKSNLVAQGSDGAFAAGSPWALASASNNFVTQGVAPGMVVQLTGPSPTFKLPQYLAVQAVASGTLTLRRCGMATGVGLPPVPSAGLTGVSFTLTTLKPQIENSAYWANEEFAVDNKVVMRGQGDMYDQRPVRRLVIVRTLYLQYMDVNRASNGDFDKKVERYKAEFDAALANAIVRWGPTGTTAPPTTRTSTRLSR